MQEAAGICWPHGGTVGHITVTTPLIRGSFASASGDDGIACCVLVSAGKYRNGAPRSWCRTHQHYWGVKSDLVDHAATGIRRCRSHADPMHYALAPRVIDMNAYETVSISLAGSGLLVQLDSAPATQQPAVAIAYDNASGLFPANGICQVNVTPPAVAAPATDCVCCARCGHPHLDLGDFAARPHRRHYCGHCGADSTHSTHPIISNPLSALIRLYASRLRFSGTIVHGKNML